MSIRARDAIILPDTGSAYNAQKRHLYFALTPCDDAGKFMAVPVGSVKSAPDCSCLLQVGDHEYIIRDSYILYAYAKLFDCGRVRADIKRGVVELMQPASDALFGRICAGMRASSFSKGWAVKKLGNPALR